MFHPLLLPSSLPARTPFECSTVRGGARSDYHFWNALLDRIFTEAHHSPNPYSPLGRSPLKSLFPIRKSARPWLWYGIIHRANVYANFYPKSYPMYSLYLLVGETSAPKILAPLIPHWLFGLCWVSCLYASIKSRISGRNETLIVASLLGVAWWNFARITYV